jgi:hypothetical protein
VWPEDVPVEVARAAEAEARRAGALRAVESPEGDDEEIPRIEVASQAPKRRREEAKVDKRAPKPKVAAAKTAKEPPAAAKRVLPPYLRVIK